MLRHLGWSQAADEIIKSIEATISEGYVTYDFARLMPNSTQLRCSEFGEKIISNMNRA